MRNILPTGTFTAVKVLVKKIAPWSLAAIVVLVVVVAVTNRGPGDDARPEAMADAIYRDSA